MAVVVVVVLVWSPPGVCQPPGLETRRFHLQSRTLRVEIQILRTHAPLFSRITVCPLSRFGLLISITPARLYPTHTASPCLVRPPELPPGFSASPFSIGNLRRPARPPQVRETASCFLACCRRNTEIRVRGGRGEGKLFVGAPHAGTANPVAHAEIRTSGRPSSVGHVGSRSVN